MLDSDNEEDATEIERNKKMIKNNAKFNQTTTINFNPRIKKKYVKLPWHFDRPETPSINSGKKEQVYSSAKKSPVKKRFAH